MPLNIRQPHLCFPAAAPTHHRSGPHPPLPRPNPSRRWVEPRRHRRRAPALPRSRFSVDARSVADPLLSRPCISDPLPTLAAAGRGGSHAATTGEELPHAGAAGEEPHPRSTAPATGSNTSRIALLCDENYKHVVKDYKQY